MKSENTKKNVFTFFYQTVVFFCRSCDGLNSATEDIWEKRTNKHDTKTQIFVGKHSWMCGEWVTQLTMEDKVMGTRVMGHDKMTEMKNKSVVI